MIIDYLDDIPNNVSVKVGQKVSSNNGIVKVGQKEPQRQVRGRQGGQGRGRGSHKVGYGFQKRFNQRLPKSGPIILCKNRHTTKLKKQRRRRKTTTTTTTQPQKIPKITLKPFPNSLFFHQTQASSKNILSRIFCCSHTQK